PGALPCGVRTFLPRASHAPAARTTLGSDHLAHCEPTNCTRAHADDERQEGRDPEGGPDCLSTPTYLRHPAAPDYPARPALLSVRLLRDLVLFELLVEIAPRRADDLRRLRDIPPVLTQLAHEKSALRVFLELPESSRLHRLAIG